MLSRHRQRCLLSMALQGTSEQVMNSVFAILMSSFFVDNLRNNPANPRDYRLESEHNEPHPSFAQTWSEIP